MSIESDLESEEGSGRSWEQLGHNMYDEKKLDFHTQVDKPDPSMAIDVAAVYWGKTISPGVGRLIALAQKRKDTRMVAFKRERAKETERMVKGNVDEEKRKKDMREVMMGQMTR